MKTLPARIVIPLAAVAMVVALYGIARADSISFGAPFWVTSNWSNSTSPTFGAKASPNNDGITCPDGSIQTGWRIMNYSGGDFYAPEGSGGSYGSFEYGTQCRQPSLAVATGARTWVTSSWSNSTSPTFGAKASSNDGITCPGGSVQTGWRIVAVDSGMGIYEYGTQCQPLVSSVALGTPYWVTSDSSSGTTPTGAASYNNKGITCPNGSVQTGWRIIHTGWSDAYGPEGSGGSYDSYEYGTQCRPISSTVISPPPPPPATCNTNSKTFDTPGSGTFVVPPGVTQIRTVVVGGGGGGGAGGGGWGSGGGGGCGGAIAGGTMTVTPGQEIPLYVGYGGAGGNGINQCPIAGYPWCGTYTSQEDGSIGGDSNIGSITAKGGGWGRTGFYNLYNQHAGGSGGGSGGGGGGNGWPGFYGQPGWGGTAGGQTNSQGSGGYCTGGGWSISPGSFITKVSYSAGEGGYAPPPRRPGINFYGPGNYVYWGGGGGGGLVINSSSVNGGNGQSSPDNGGKGYGGGGGGSNIDNKGVGGTGASGVVYVEWEGGATNSCGISCTITFDQNPLTGPSTIVRWSSTGLGPTDTFKIETLGNGVPASGQAQVFSPGNYSGTLKNAAGQVIGSCPATLAGSGGTLCPDGTPAPGGNPSQCTCAHGNTSRCTGGTLCPDGSPAPDNDISKCSEGRTCTPTSRTCNARSGVITDNCGNRTVCPGGCSVITNQCIVTSCPEGFTLRSGQCIRTSCPEGWTLQDGYCIPPSSVEFESFSAISRELQPFTATGKLQAIPSLVRQGETSRIYWKAINAASCTVSGTNGDVWENVSFSGGPGKTTRAITSQVVYTLICNARTGATPASVRATAVVNVIPTFQEQ